MNFDNKHSKIISEFFGCNFSAPSNSNLSPGQTVATLVSKGLSAASAEDDKNQQSPFKQLDSNWGIQPSWSKRLLINAQSETVLTKSTFKEAIKTHRCLIPCSGWYEWRTEGNNKKKYLFSHVNEEPLLMAGIWYSNQDERQIEKVKQSENQISYPDSSGSNKQNSSPKAKQQLVTLTTEPNAKCAEYHLRMPVIILPQYRDFWFQSPAEQLSPLFQAIDQRFIKISAA
ncbi:SOS response-associated peptidase [Colwellia sp. 75C3]|uniref:SOS response-associated peptidase n=1 Tax=Colwellia sp. 75C3 TaxID=888425 RepID=UPI001E43B15C|nr:SOS response-associated peptidase family protein [Colwellia sp. 75C3]